jgi:hypothetical protein
MEGASHMVSFGKDLHLTAPAKQREALVRLDYEEAAEWGVGQNYLTLHRSRLREVVLVARESWAHAGPKNSHCEKNGADGHD